MDTFQITFVSQLLPIIKDKNGKSDAYDNYRPISSVTMFSKIFKLCVRTRIVPLLHVDDLQYGFCVRKGMSENFVYVGFSC